eukprot:TRINITY_DN25396_c0_g1_i1.p1 TRINITY_DN25396_c0_g1~~TRINITY_DN25396_c0_g1_i1.p1  ORF type:complete len:164 (+),score=20.16 TRINITY_DN25396_c0_g1_i1:91-582(+)
MNSSDASSMRNAERVWQTVVKELPVEKKIFYANSNVRHVNVLRRLQMEKKALFSKEVNSLRAKSLYEAEWNLKYLHVDLDTHLLSDMRIKTDATRCLVRQSLNKPEKKLAPIPRNYYESLQLALKQYQDIAAAEDRRVLRRANQPAADKSADRCQPPRFLPPL